MPLVQCARCDTLLECAASTPDVECWCVSMPTMPTVDDQKGCYCGQCYIEVFEEHKRTINNNTGA